MNPPGPPDPDRIRAASELRQRIRELSDRTAELDAEISTLTEVRDRLQADQRALSARLTTTRSEREELEAQLCHEARRATSIDEDIRQLVLDNTALEVEADAIEKDAARRQQEAAALASSLAAHREQQTQLQSALSGALGTLAHMEYKLRDGPTAGSIELPRPSDDE